MKRKFLTAGLAFVTLLVFAGITEAGGWMHRTEGWTREAKNPGPAKLRVENLPVFEVGKTVAASNGGTRMSSKSDHLEVENYPAFDGGVTWGPVETGTIKGGGSAMRGMENPTVLEGGKYGGD